MNFVVGSIKQKFDRIVSKFAPDNCAHCGMSWDNEAHDICSELCLICRLNFEKGDELKQCIDCLTHYHREHIETWYELNEYCPVCKVSLREEFDDLNYCISCLNPLNDEKICEGCFRGCMVCSKGIDYDDSISYCETCLSCFHGYHFNSVTSSNKNSKNQLARISKAKSNPSIFEVYNNLSDLSGTHYSLETSNAQEKQEIIVSDSCHNCSEQMNNRQDVKPIRKKIKISREFKRDVSQKSLRIITIISFTFWLSVLLINFLPGIYSPEYGWVNILTVPLGLFLISIFTILLGMGYVTWFGIVDLFVIIIVSNFLLPKEIYQRIKKWDKLEHRVHLETTVFPYNFLTYFLLLFASMIYVYFKDFQVTAALFQLVYLVYLPLIGIFATYFFYREEHFDLIFPSDPISDPD